MASYLLTYYGGGMPESEAEQAQVMQAWTAWFGELGDAVLDGGNPTSHSRAISPDGSVMEATSAPTGYSIIKADSLDAAVTAGILTAEAAAGFRALAERRRTAPMSIHPRSNTTSAPTACSWANRRTAPSAPTRS